MNIAPPEGTAATLIAGVAAAASAHGSWGSSRDARLKTDKQIARIEAAVADAARPGPHHEEHDR